MTLQRSQHACTGFTVALFLAAFSVACDAQTAAVPAPQIIHSRGNPILSDGSYYSADPAPIVVGDTLYILAGRDEAPPNRNDFVMNEWQIFATKDVASHVWLHYPDILRPETVFAWSKPGHAYAGQIVEGPDHRFYLYAPVQEGKREHRDPFVIGVAVSDTSAWAMEGCASLRVPSSRNLCRSRTTFRTSIPQRWWTTTGACTSTGEPSGSCAA